MAHSIADIRDSLGRLGLKPGDAVYVHTSLRRVGPVEGGAGGLVEAFLSALGPEGTLAVPCHSLSFPGLGKEPYDAALSPGVTGAFPEYVRKLMVSCRSAHPSHSSAAIGAGAEQLTQGHDIHNALGFHSPLQRLYRGGGKVLLLGVNHTANTSIHLAELLSGVPYTRLHYDARWGDPWLIDRSGAVVTVPQERYPGCSSHFGVMEGLLKRVDITAYGLVGNATCQLMDMKELVDFTIGILKERPDFLLCHDPNCPACPDRRKLLEGQQDRGAK